MSSLLPVPFSVLPTCLLYFQHLPLYTLHVFCTPYPFLYTLLYVRYSPLPFPYTPNMSSVLPIPFPPLPICLLYSLFFPFVYELCNWWRRCWERREDRGSTELREQRERQTRGTSITSNNGKGQRAFLIVLLDYLVFLPQPGSLSCASRGTKRFCLIKIPDAPYRIHDALPDTHICLVLNLRVSFSTLKGNVRVDHHKFPGRSGKMWAGFPLPSPPVHSAINGYQV